MCVCLLRDIHFRTNFNTNSIKLTHYFPEKYLEGYYEVENTILRPGVITVGRFNLTLCKKLFDQLLNSIYYLVIDP